MTQVENSQKYYDYLVDASALKCPMPLLKMKQALNQANVGEVILVKVSDPASQRDFGAFIELTPHKMTQEICEQQFWYWITKNS